MIPFENVFYNNFPRDEQKIYQFNQGEEIDVDKINKTLEFIFDKQRSFVNLIFPYRSLYISFNIKEEDLNQNQEKVNLTSDYQPFQTINMNIQTEFFQKLKFFNKFYLIRIPLRIPIPFQQKTVIFGYMLTYQRRFVEPNDFVSQDPFRLEKLYLNIKEFLGDETSINKMKIQESYNFGNVVIFDEAIQIPVIYYPNQRKQFAFSGLKSEEQVIAQYFQQTGESKIVDEKDQFDPLFDKTQIIQNVDRVELVLYKQKTIVPDQIYNDNLFVFIPCLQISFTFPISDEEQKTNEIDFCNALSTLIDTQHDYYQFMNYPALNIKDQIKQQLSGKQIVFSVLNYQIKQVINLFLQKIQSYINDENFEEYQEKFNITLDQHQSQISLSNFGFSVFDVFTHYILNYMKMYFENFKQQKITYLDLYQFLQEIQNLGAYNSYLFQSKIQHPQLTWLKDNVINTNPEQLVQLIQTMSENNVNQILNWFQENPLERYLFKGIGNIDFVRSLIETFFNIPTKYSFQQQQEASYEEINRVYQEFFNLIIKEQFLLPRELFSMLFQEDQQYCISFVIETIIQYYQGLQVSGVQSFQEKMRQQTEVQQLKNIKFYILN